MLETRNCPKCGASLPLNAPSGICPKCLLQAGLESHPHGAAARFVPPSPVELARLFPHLEILELLGKGGMGAVYKARQASLDRLVAIKILPPEFGADPAFAERFSREARALARLNHPHIVSVYEFGEIDGHFYFIMEYVDGVNIRQLIATGGLQPGRALAIVPQICEALQFAHDQGIVHRDIKPENILVDRQGRVKIADFGLAKLVGQEAAEPTLTAAHQVVGTWQYMAPEQMRGAGHVDHRADIYSLGVVFYEMLTGELPVGRFAPPSRKVQVDVRLDEVVLKALEQEPARRYQHASDIKCAVEATAVTEWDARPQDAPLQRPARADHDLRGPANALLAAGLAMLLSAVGYFVIMYGEPFSLDASLERIKRHDPTEFTVAGLQIATLPAAMFAILGAMSLRRTRSTGVAYVGCFAMMLPLTPGWLISMPLAVWTLMNLRPSDGSHAVRHA